MGFECMDFEQDCLRCCFASYYHNNIPGLDKFLLGNFLHIDYLSHRNNVGLDPLIFF